MTAVEPSPVHLSKELRNRKKKKENKPSSQWSESLRERPSKHVTRELKRVQKQNEAAVIATAPWLHIINSMVASTKTVNRRPKRDFLAARSHMHPSRRNNRSRVPSTTRSSFCPVSYPSGEKYFKHGHTAALLVYEVKTYGTYETDYRL